MFCTVCVLLQEHIRLYSAVFFCNSRSFLIARTTTCMFTELLVQVISNFHFLCCYTADCGPPPFLLNGAVSYQATTEGSEGHYHCNDGFTMEGGMTTMCGANGSWDSSPLCRPQTGMCMYTSASAVYQLLKHLGISTGKSRYRALHFRCNVYITNTKLIHI